VPGPADEYAADIDRLLPPEPGTVLEIGVGTGVVAAPYDSSGQVIRVERAWPSHPGYELDSIRNPAWSALRRLDDRDYQRSAGPAISALQALPQEETTQRAFSEFAAMTRQSG
jgi:hypothetical protein